MAYQTDAIVNKLIGVVIFIAIFVALVPTVLTYIGNLSTSGIILASVVGSIAGILLGVFALKAVMKHLS